MKNNKFPWSNMHGFNLDWVIETVKDVKSLVDGIVQEVTDIFKNYVTKTDLEKDFNNRKLSPTGNFTGTLANMKNAIQVTSEIDNNRNQIGYIASQFLDGQTGFVVDGGFFTEEGIKNNYNGGVF